MDLVANRFDVFLVNLDPTMGAEMKKTRPCLIVSPDESNRHLRTVVIAPMTSKGRAYPTRVPAVFQEQEGQIVIDQIRVISRERLVKRLGKIEAKTQREVVSTLQAFFSL
jgi:mRNA interferase MazF